MAETPRRTVAASTVTVRDVTIGAGEPAIIVPLTGSTVSELGAQARALAGHAYDIVEWRADHFDTSGELDAVVDTAWMLRELLPATPLLFTCRTMHEGGEFALDDDAYARVLLAIIDSGAVDLVDVESARPVVDSVLAAARASRVPVILSHHDFAATPSKAELVTQLREMQDLGGDIIKVAVMPRSTADVVALLDATREIYEHHADRPLITVSMGALGGISRVGGHVFGSAATFGTVGAASAPGQFDADELRRAVNLLRSRG